MFRENNAVMVNKLNLPFKLEDIYFPREKKEKKSHKDIITQRKHNLSFSVKFCRKIPMINV